MGCGSSVPAPPKVHGVWASSHLDSSGIQALANCLQREAQGVTVKMGGAPRVLNAKGALLVVQPSGDVSWICDEHSYRLYNGPILEWRDNVWLGCCHGSACGCCCPLGCFHFDVSDVQYRSGEGDTAEGTFMTVNGLFLRKLSDTEVKSLGVPVVQPKPVSM